MNVRAISSLTWLLPAATIVFVLYVVGGIAGARMFGVPIVAILLLSLPPMILTWLALIVALVDVTQRPKGEFSEEARLIWLLLLALLNVLAFIPYWLLVIRRHGRVPVSSA